MAIIGKSQCGFEAYGSYNDTRHLYRFLAAGQKWWAFGPNTAVVAAEFINRFNKEVEPIKGKVLDDWSFAPRLVKGSSSVISNHASAAAWDLNALQHPLGVRGTFSSVQLKNIRKIISEIVDGQGRPVLRHGAFYTGRIDAMHVEINATKARVDAASHIIQARPGYKSVKA